MLLYRIHLDPRCREVRRDLSDPYQLHSTLCRAFSTPEEKCPVGTFLWRLEPETDSYGNPRVLTQSDLMAEWSRIGASGWLAKADPPIDLRGRLKLDSLKVGQQFRFRLRANPCMTRNGKRLALHGLHEQEAWIGRKAEQHGFSLFSTPTFGDSELPKERIDVRVSQEQMMRGRQRGGNDIRVFSVLFDGVLKVTDPQAFRMALQAGIGHGKVMGLGLLSIAPTS